MRIYRRRKIAGYPADWFRQVMRETVGGSITLRNIRRGYWVVLIRGALAYWIVCKRTILSSRQEAAGNQLRKGMHWQWRRQPRLCGAQLQHAWLRSSSSGCAI